MMNRRNLPGVANPMNRPLPVVMDPIGRVLRAMPNKNMVRPIVSFGPKKGMKINFA